MEGFKKLSPEEKDVLLEAPAYISLLAANADGKMDEVEKKEAVRFSHIKTFSCDPLLKDFYLEAEKKFLYNIEKLDKELPPGKQERERAIYKKLKEMEPVFFKLGKDYSTSLRRSLESYAGYVYKAHWNVLVSFIFPLFEP